MGTAAQDPLCWAQHELIVLLAGQAAEKLASRGSGRGWVRLRTDVELRAFHEAGHAIAGVVAGRTVYRLTVIPDPLREVGPSGRYISAGLCLWSEPDLSAERRVKRTVESDRTGAARLAMAWATPLQKPQWKYALQVIREYRLKAEAMLSACWPIVTKLAIELEQRGTLTADEIAAITGRVAQPAGRGFSPMKGLLAAAHGMPNGTVRRDEGAEQRPS